MKNIVPLLLLSSFTAFNAFTQTMPAGSWPEATNVNKPWARWWWMGNAVDEPNLDLRLKQYAAAGFGGVEITPIYGAKGYESKFIDFLSPRWMDLLDYTVQDAAKYGMLVDLNAGTGWPFGGPQISPQYAASKLIVQQYEIPAGGRLQENIEVKDSQQASMGASVKALMAISSTGAKISLLDKLDKAGQLNWQAPASAGSWTVYAAFSGYTRQKVKRAAPGGEGYTMDHFSADAFHTYLQRFDEAFGKKDHHIRSFFNDSYEVYNADFTPQLFTEFKKRRGYDLEWYLPELTGESQTDSASRIRADYRQTLAELVYENFSSVWYDWVKGKKGLSRNQAHGFPGNIIDIYAKVDIPEPEMFGIIKFPIKGFNYYTEEYGHETPDPVMMKLASSAAGLLGKPLVSCEIFTWLGEHFQVPLSHCKPEAQQAFLAGVNHVVYHGATYSPEEAGWPGWLFYASTNFAPSNSWWPQVNGLNEYITRCQSILQQGVTDNDIVLYWPYADAQYHSGKKLEFLVAINSIGSWLKPSSFYKASNALTDQGYTLDYISDKYIVESKVQDHNLVAAEAGNRYKALVIPATEFMPVETMQHIIRLAEQGAHVVLQSIPEKVPGIQGIAAAAEKLEKLVAAISFREAGKLKVAQVGKGEIVLSEDVAEGVAYYKLRSEQLAQDGLGFIRKHIDGDTWYYLVNHTGNDLDKEVALHTAGQYATIFDPQTGMIGDAKRMESKLRLQLRSGDALFVRISNTTSSKNAWKYIDKLLPAIAVTSPWKLSFTNGGAEMPAAQQLQKLSDWTALADERAKNFSGTGTYTTTVAVKKNSYKANDFQLDLGDVRESAHVWVNGQDAGIAWYPPYTLNIGRYLKEGKNDLKVEVVNLMANRIADLDRKKIQWRNYYEINFVNIHYKSFDASDWKPQPSGLLGDVNIRPVVWTK